MAFCTNCGARLPDGSKFCTFCGERVQENSGSILSDKIPNQSPEQNSAMEPLNVPAPDQSGNARQTTALHPPIRNTYTPPRINSGTPGFTFQNLGKSGAPKKRKAVWLIVLLCAAFAALFVFVLAKVLGSFPSDRDVLGLYNGVSCTVDGVDLGIDDEWLELKSGKVAQINILGDSYVGKWSLDGETLTITQQGDNYIGTLCNGVITIDFIGMEYVFAKDCAQIPAAAATEATTTKTGDSDTESASAVNTDWWDGDWYGWWVMTNCSGSWSSLEDNFWDTCASIEIDSDGIGYINIWDSDNEAGKCFAQANVVFVDMGYSQPVMANVDGLFWDSELTEAQWIVNPDDTPMGNQIDNVIEITGTYTDGEDGGFDYTIFLRPWGTEWEDVRNADTSELMYEDMMPRYYDSWYLPLIQSGVTKAPDTIG